MITGQRGPPAGQVAGLIREKRRWRDNTRIAIRLMAETGIAQAAQKADAARLAKYGRLICPDCGQVYGVDLETFEVEDHTSRCRPLTESQKWG